MVKISKQDDNFIFEVQHWHKLWALKSELTIPAAHILKVHRDVDSIRGWKGWKLIGTYMPGVLTAGTFYKSRKKVFWDVSDIEKCIIIELDHEFYNRLIVEVENPEAAIKVLTT